MPAGGPTHLTWVREDPSRWDEDKARVIGSAPEGVFEVSFEIGDELPGDWWVVSDAAGGAVGYGWLDTTWGGDAEVLLAVESGHQSQGIGSFILRQLEMEAAHRGINYIHNRIREHARRDLVHDWLIVRGFRGYVDSDLRKRVSAHEASKDLPAPRPGQVPQQTWVATRQPGHEEQGGYVDVDEHRF